MIACRDVRMHVLRLCAYCRTFRLVLEMLAAHSCLSKPTARPCLLKPDSLQGAAAAAAAMRHVHPVFDIKWLA